MPVIVPDGSITLLKSAVLTPCMTPISTRLRFPAAYFMRHPRSSAVVGVPAGPEPSRGRSQRDALPFSMARDGFARSATVVSRRPDDMSWASLAQDHPPRYAHAFGDAPEDFVDVIVPQPRASR